MSTLALFWTAHFALSGLARAVVPSSTALPSGLLQAFGVAEFAVSGLFALAFLQLLVGLDEERGEAARFVEWAGAGALAILAAEHVVAGLVASQNGPPYSAAILLVMTTLAFRWTIDIQPARGTDEAGPAHGAAGARARLAAMTTDLAYLRRRRPMP
ncbi:hypothetical protein [Pararhizobium haloflavum]|uniref:hypothetical protein n=1 Tax=Pararhizobium haloflavum TaxID=2037914 RepID=UPI0012FFD418|nr:hypothetical protein [Pararhizobium haloflavum]